MAYIALKPCNFAGQAFKIGETVPADLVQPGAAKNLVKMGIIAAEGTETQAAAPVAEPAPSTIEIAIHLKDGDLNVGVTPENMQTVFDVLTGSAKDAEKTIEGITDGDTLILIHATDSRKSVKELAEAKAKELAGDL